jgi:hypothetical protein
MRIKRTMFVCLAVAFLLSVFTSSGAIAAPPQLKAGLGWPQVSGAKGAAITLDVRSFFEDPDGDSFSMVIAPWAPLPTGLSFDGSVISGNVPNSEGIGWSVRLLLEVENNDTSRSWAGIWTYVSYGAATSLFYRVCDPLALECIPGGSYSVAERGFVGEDKPDANNSASQYPVAESGEATRGAGSVGYEGASLTPAISAYLRPANERLTASHFGLARYTLTGDLTIDAELSYDQTGGALAPQNPSSGDPLDFGAMAQASIFTFQLLEPDANGVIDPALCNWQALGYGAVGSNIRDVLVCIINTVDGINSYHPHIIELAEAEFNIDETGPEDTSNTTITPTVANGLVQAQLTITHPGGAIDPKIFVGVQMFQMARYGGEVNSQNSLHISFDNPDVVQPEMENVTEPTFAPAAASGGRVVIAGGQCININGKGRIPLAIFSSAGMAAADVDVNTIEFAGLELATRGRGTPACSIDDLNVDGLDDLVCQFSDDENLWTGEAGVLKVTWFLKGGADLFSATDLVCLTE